MPLNVLVRDFPETLAVLLRAGVDVRRYGGDSIGEIAGAETAAGSGADSWASKAADHTEGIARAIVWREGPAAEGTPGDAAGSAGSSPP